MCSDGLSDMLSDARLAQILQGNTLLPEMAQSLIAAANDMAARDNIALILVRINSQGRGNPRVVALWAPQSVSRMGSIPMAQTRG